MTYLALLSSSLLGRIQMDDRYFTPFGSSHGADHLFPKHINFHRTNGDLDQTLITLSQWKEWKDEAIKNYSHNNLCIIRAGWNVIPQSIWNDGLKMCYEPIVLVSSPNSKLDWIYCWFNMISKVPRHVYDTLNSRSKFYPRLWAKDKLRILPKHVKISEMTSGMPIHPTHENIEADNVLRFSTTDILSENFPKTMMDYLNDHGLPASCKNSIIENHKKFVNLQMPNYQRALSVSQGIFPDSRGPFDDVLFNFLNTNDPWAKEGHPR